MPHNTLMTAAPVAVVDALNSLLEAEQNSVFRFMGEGSPYLSRATAEVRRPLQQMVETSYRHCGELHSLIEHLGGDPRPRGLQPEEQYLAFLSLKFLLPKLVNAKKLTIRRYENTLKSIVKFPARELRVEIAQILVRLLEELRGVQVPQSVRREVTDRPIGPVDVLQTPARIVGRGDAKVFLHPLVPRGRDVGRGQVAVQHRLF